MPPMNEGAVFSYKGQNGYIPLYPVTTSGQVEGLQLGQVFGPLQITLLASAWENNQQSVSVLGISETDILTCVNVLSNDMTTAMQQDQAYSLLDPYIGINSIENGVKIINADEASSKSHQNTKKFFDEKTIDIVEIIFGAILFIIGEFTSLVPDQYTLYLYIVAYLILGFHVLKTAITNLFHGNVFDENFLMSIATLGAFAIKEYPEAVGVMLFYRIGEYFEERATEKSRS